MAHHHDLAAGCGGHVTAKQAQPFIERVWNPDRWARHGGAPKHSTVVAYKQKLRCAGPANRKAMKHRWKKAKRAFKRHRHYKLRWGDCTDAGPVPDCIHGAAETYGADEAWMLRVSYCESTWNRYAVNPSGSTGLFQFKKSTWASTPFGGRSIWSVRFQALAAAWMQISGRSGEWVCQ